jgi:hypothetical protein
MNESKRDPLDELLASAPRDVQPTRDLWTGIEAGIRSSEQLQAAQPAAHSRSGWYRLAAGVLLMIATSATTYVLTRQSMEKEMQTTVANQPAVNLPATATSFDTQAFGADYAQTRAALYDMFKERLATLPPETRDKLERNLNDLHRAADEISATLAQNPSDPLLQQLLASTYESELQFLADVSGDITMNSTRADL